MDPKKTEMQLRNAFDSSDSSRPRLFSVGHSNHELVHFLSLLRGAGITAIADVRSQPYSQRVPQFNKPDLAHALREHDLGYAFLGDSLGGRPRASSLYDSDGRVQYERVRASAAFQRGLDRLIGSLEEFTVGMLCSEEDPLDCHRGLMIAPALVLRGIRPSHLRADGSLETTAEFESRLLEATKAGAGILDGLFAAVISEEERADLLAEAYQRQSRRKAFRLRPDFTAEDDVE